MLNINYNDIKSRPITYIGWATSITFSIPTGRQALVICNNSAVILLWNPPDNFNSAMLYGDANLFTITRASNKTTFTVSRSSNSTWTAFVLI